MFGLKGTKDRLPVAPIPHYSRIGLTIEVGERSIEIREKRSLRTEVTILPLQQIASVRATGITLKDVEIIMSSGVRHSYMIGRDGAGVARAIQEAI